MTAAGYTRKPGTLLWGRHVTDVDVITAARHRMTELYERFDRVIVSFSGGKDSTIVLRLALEAAEAAGRLPVRAVFSDEEAIPYETEEYVRRVITEEGPERLSLEWWCVPTAQRNAAAPGSPFWWCWDPDVGPDGWCRPLPPEALTVDDVPRFTGGRHFPTSPAGARPAWQDFGTWLCRPQSPADGSTVIVMGIRAQESLTRLKAVSHRTEDNWINQNTGETGYSKAYPIYDWTSDDVWHAIGVNRWDYNAAYDLMEMAGVSLVDSRVAPPYANEPLAALWQFPVCFPEVWARMSERVPGAGAAVRYARTELYDFGGRGGITKPPGVAWSNHIAALLARWDDGDDGERLDARGHTAEMVRLYMTNHFARTDDPLLEVPHPLSKISWLYLQKLAVRGKFKTGRGEPPSSDLPWIPYLREFVRVRDAGLLWEVGAADDTPMPAPPAECQAAFEAEVDAAMDRAGR